MPRKFPFLSLCDGRDPLIWQGIQTELLVTSSFPVVSVLYVGSAYLERFFWDPGTMHIPFSVSVLDVRGLLTWRGLLGALQQADSP